MMRKTRRVGAFASAALSIAFLFGATGSGAVAQEGAEEQTPIAPAMPVIEIPQLEDEAETQNETSSDVRFVASPVVQEVPQESETPITVPTANAANLTDLVATTSHDGALSRELRCLAQAIYFESRGEPLAGQLAVARVIINRSASSLFPDNYCSVVTQRAQFSFVKGGRIPSPNTASGAWKRAKKIARIAHQDLWESEAADALFFHANHVRPRWARSKTTRATIDNHIFYR